MNEKDDLNNQPVKKNIKYQLRHFTVLQKIGYGVFGKVYQVKYEKTGELYAAKILKQELENESDRYVQDISREVNIISKLNHRGVIKFIYYSSHNFKYQYRPVIITEYASNGSLEDFIQLNRKSSKSIFTDTQKLIIIYGIASGMKYLHLHDIIHRDLKPSNILLDQYLYPKIADFGLSKIHNSFTKEESSSTTSFKGTPKYMSPEIWENNTYSKKSDVYAFALIVYEIFSKQEPFKNCTFFEIPQLLENNYRPKFEETTPEAYKNLISRCWSRAEFHRPYFKTITNELKTNPDFITESVDKEAFLQYVKYIDEYNTSFNQSENVFYFKNIDNIAKNKSVTDSKKLKIIMKYLSNQKIYTYKEFIKLDKGCKKLIKNAINNPQQQFIIGKYHIKGINNFPQNTQIGIKLLKRSFNEGCIESLIYFCKMLIKGNIIPQDLKKAKKLIENNINKNDPFYSFLYGKIKKKEKKYEEAKQYFEYSSELGNGKAMYELGKMMLKGIHFHIDVNESIQYFKKAIEKNCSKAMLKYGMLLMKENRNKEDGIKYIKMSADNNCFKAMYYYSIMLKKGEAISKNKDERFKYLKKSAENGYIKAMHDYGMLYQEDENLVSEDESYSFLEKACDKGHMESIHHYGMMLYKNSFELEINPKAAKYLKIAADEGYSDAIDSYGVVLLDGTNVDIDEGIKYIKKGIEKGNSDSMYHFSILLACGKAIGIDIKESKKYLQIAIEKGNSDAMNRYAMILNEEKKTEEAIKYFKMAIDLGNSNAMLCYAQIIDNIIDDKEAIKYYKMSIELGNQWAMIIYGSKLSNGYYYERQEAMKYFKIAVDKGNKLAEMYYQAILDKLIVEPASQEKTLKYFKKNIDENDSKAIYKYGKILRYGGYNVEINKKEALKYYKKAADLGYSKAIFQYAYMLINGEGIDHDCVDFAEVTKYLKMSIDEGNDNAMFIYANMLIEGKFVEQNIEESIKYYKMAIDCNNSNAMFNYALMLHEGYGIPVNKKEAIKYYRKAIRYDCSNAMINYANMIEYGEEIKKDLSKAFTFLKMACLLKNMNAINYIYRFVQKYPQFIDDLIDLGEEDYYSEDDIRSLVNVINDPLMNQLKELMKTDLIKVFKVYKDPMQIIKTAADQYNYVALYYYAFYLRRGIKVDVNKEEAIKYCKMGIEEENVNLINEYADILYEGDGVKADKKEASKYFKLAADLGKEEAMERYAKILYEGDGIEVNKEEAFKYYKMSADAIHQKLISEYSDTFETWKGFSNDFFKKKMEYDDKAVQLEILSYVMSLNKCASMLNEGDGIPANKEEAFQYFKIAADLGLPINKRIFANILKNGDGVPINKEEAFKYYKLAADQKDVDSMVECAIMLYSGDGVEINKKEAFKYYKMAAESQHQESMYKCADMLYEGDGIEVNKEEAFKYYKMSADAIHQKLISEYSDTFETWKGFSNDFFKKKMEYDDKAVQLEILSYVAILQKCASMLYEGDGIPANKEEAFQYFKIAADLGFPFDKNVLATLLKNGDGVPINKEEAFKYYKLAADQKDVDSMVECAIMLYSGDGVEVNKEEALKYVKMAADEDNTTPMFFWGYLLENGIGVPINKNEAFKYYKMAAELGNMKSISKCVNMLESGDIIPNDKEETQKYNKEAEKAKKNSEQDIDTVIHISQSNNQYNGTEFVDNSTEKNLVRPPSKDDGNVKNRGVNFRVNSSKQLSTISNPNRSQSVKNINLCIQSDESTSSTAAQNSVTRNSIRSIKTPNIVHPKPKPNSSKLHISKVLPTSGQTISSENLPNDQNLKQQKQISSLTGDLCSSRKSNGASPAATNNSDFNQNDFPISEPKSSPNSSVASPSATIATKKSLISHHNKLPPIISQKVSMPTSQPEMSTPLIFSSHPPEPEDSYASLLNQGATCYMNSVLQSLFHIPLFRRSVFELPTEDETDKEHSIPLNLQALFCNLLLAPQELKEDQKKQYKNKTDESNLSCAYISKFMKPVSTQNLTKSFGWNSSETLQQQDIQEFFRVLLNKLDEKIDEKNKKNKETKENIENEGNETKKRKNDNKTNIDDENKEEVKHVSDIFKGQTIFTISGEKSDFKSERYEDFYDLSLSVKDCSNLENSFLQFTKKEHLSDLYDTGIEGHEKIAVQIQAQLFKLPKVLTLHLQRFEYDFVHDSPTKIYDELKFPKVLDTTPFLHNLSPFKKQGKNCSSFTLTGVLIHSGDALFGHYYVFLRPKLVFNEDGSLNEEKSSFYEFNDSSVRRVTEKEAINDNFGGYENYLNESNSSTYMTYKLHSAYMLIYSRNDCLREIYDTSYDIPNYIKEYSKSH